LEKRIDLLLGAELNQPDLKFVAVAPLQLGQYAVEHLLTMGAALHPEQKPAHDSSAHTSRVEGMGTEVVTAVGRPSSQMWQGFSVGAG